ncbi:MAG: hypothetical protein Q8938_13215 [Bacteroidota bacterium]|nr:hypothetical protein [Bacteroidota bacterium]MDP4258076.1 hypothetical protein [Bacteroidota bacterium]
MEEPYFPKSLIHIDSHLEIFWEEDGKLNSTKSSVVIQGNREGFLSLANMINVYNVYLFQEINISDFPFVSSSFKFCIFQDESVQPSTGIVIREPIGILKWMISETNLFVVTGLLHSLGYANNELHFDNGLKYNDISLYCIVK